MLILRGVNFSLLAIDQDARLHELNVTVFSKGYFMLLDGSFLNSDVCGMLGGKDYRAVNTVLLVLRIYINNATGFKNNLNLNGAHCMDSGLVSKVCLYNYDRER